MLRKKNSVILGTVVKVNPGRRRVVATSYDTSPSPVITNEQQSQKEIGPAVDSNLGNQLLDITWVQLRYLGDL